MVVQRHIESSRIDLMKLLADILVVVCSVLGSTLIAFNIGLNSLGYFCFIIASLSTLYLLRMSTASKSLYIVNGFFLVINIIGLFRY